MDEIEDITKNLELTTLDDVKNVKIGIKAIIKKFIDIINNDFDHKMTPDGYSLSDMFIRPKDLNGDWLRVAVRYSSFNSIISHSVNENIPSYVLVYLTNYDRTWIMIRKDMIVKCIQIRPKMKNKYDKFEVKTEDIIEKLKICYETCNLVADTDDTKYCIIEYNNTGEHNKFEFAEIKKRFVELNCQLLTTQEEYIKGEMHTKTKMKVMMSCGHQDILSLCDFQKRRHSICQQCIYQEVKKNSYNEVKKVATGNLNESISFDYIKNLFKNVFEVKKTHEGCKCDMIIKPLNMLEDKWLGIQLKTMIYTKRISQYTFNRIGKYPDIVIICIAMKKTNNKIWIFNGNDLLDKTSLSIGIKDSKYDKNEVLKENIVELMKTKYDIYPKHYSEDLNIPTCIKQQIEHENRLFREKILNNQFMLEYPTIDGSKYDIIINNFKVQDKCSRKVTDANSYYYVYLTASKNYKLGDNDFYWINMPDSNFYIIPEKILLEDNGNIIIRITLNKKYEDYYFKYDDPNIIQKLKEVFG